MENQKIQPNKSPLGELKPLGSKVEEKPKRFGFLLANKGLVGIIAIAIIAVIVGFSALTSLGDTSQYQGLIKKVEQQTQVMGE